MWKNNQMMNFIVLYTHFICISKPVSKAVDLLNAGIVICNCCEYEATHMPCFLSPSWCFQEVNAKMFERICMSFPCNINVKVRLVLISIFFLRCRQTNEMRRIHCMLRTFQRKVITLTAFGIYFIIYIHPDKTLLNVVWFWIVF